MDAEETVVATETTVCCDGGDGALGHPAVYLHFEDGKEIVCPYCSRRFVLSETASAASGH
jgi:uncharacterized Zn-finger protein